MRTRCCCSSLFTRRGSFLHRPRLRPGLYGVLLVLVVASSLYLYPYFLWEMRKAETALVYFGHTPLDYGRGIFESLPVWLDLPASWLSLAGAKLLYFTGLRPSYGVTAPALVLARAAAGIVLLPGLLYLFVAAPKTQRALVALYCLHIFLGPTPERYYLAIYPILFLYGTMVWDAAFRHLLRFRAAASAPPRPPSAGTARPGPRSAPHTPP